MHREAIGGVPQHRQGAPDLTAAPQDVTAEELRLERFSPADQANQTRHWT